MSFPGWTVVPRRAAVVCVCLLASPALGQSLFRQVPPPKPQDANAEPDPQAALKSASLFVVETPKQRALEVHDKVTIIVSETSKQTSEQKLDTKKDASLALALRKFPDLAKLLEAELENTDNTTLGVDGIGKEKFKGNGKYERADRFVDKITATVIDVKPNGVLVLEARRTIGRDKEIQVLVLAGECRREDVTDANTVLSSQLADLTLVVKNEGQVKDAATKGVLARVFEAVFNF